MRRLIMEGDIKGYRIGRYRARLIRADLDAIDEKLMNPIGPYWKDNSARPPEAQGGQAPFPNGWRPSAAQDHRA
jgi:hypothetical protein